MTDGNHYFFVRELPLILRVGRKLKKRTGEICKRALYIEFKEDSSVDLGTTLGDGKKIKKKIYFSSFMDFSG